uniref:Rab-GAP TBC domain-containing protein n=1 Tax=Arcella intermedia TaxID=1963864 RepID=A0A6B2L446_9EUKA
MMRYLNLKKTPFESGLYEKLLQEEGNRVLLKQIEKDLPRTFPYHPFFVSKEGREALGRILKAFSLKHPEIGYTQAMNFIAGFLLLLMEEELAFKVTTIIVEYIVPGYYMNTMTGLQADQLVLCHLVKETLPELSEHLPKIGVDLKVVTTKWFLCLYIHTLPFASVIRVWDILFCRGPATLILVGVAMLKMKQEQILSIQTCIKNSMEFFDQFTQGFYNWEELIATMYSISSFSRVEQLQQYARERVGLRVKRRQIKDLEGMTQFTEEELEELEGKFTSIAKNGSVTKADFHKLFDKKYQLFMKDPQITDYLFNEFDQNGDGTLDFRDYVMSLSTLDKGSPKTKLRLLQRIFDQEKKGYFTPEDLTKIFKWQFTAMGFKEVDEMVSVSVETAFAMYDYDKDGRLNFEEFFLACHKQPGIVEMLDLMDMNQLTL